jgi:hypothetical protein
MSSRLEDETRGHTDEWTEERSASSSHFMLRDIIFGLSLSLS